MATIKLTDKLDHPLVSSLHFLDNAKLVINGYAAKDWQSLPTEYESLVALGAREGRLLLAKPVGESVEIYVKSDANSRMLDSVSSYSFSWGGGFIGSAIYYLVTSDGLLLREIDGDSGERLIINCPPTLRVSSSQDRLVFVDGQELTHFVIKRNPLRHSDEWVCSLDFDVSFVLVRDNVVAILGRDGQFAFLRAGIGKINRGAAAGLNGVCLTAIFLNQSQVRTFWASGWIVDFHVDSHEGLKIDVQHGLCFRAALSGDGGRIALWDGSHVFEYDIYA